MDTRIYFVVKYNTWCSPGMLVAVNKNNEIVWVQTTEPKNLNRIYMDEGQEKFNLYNYQFAILVTEP
jgi:hypothetical protein